MNKTWEEHYPELTHYFDDEGKTPKGKDKYTYKFKRDKSGVITNYYDRRTPSTNQFKDNLIYNSPNTPFAMADSREKVVEDRGFYTVQYFRLLNGKMQDNLIHSNNKMVKQDPGFLDYKKHNLIIKKGSPILNQFPHLNNDYYNKIGRK